MPRPSSRASAAFDAAAAAGEWGLPACRPARLKTGCRNEASLQSPILIECFLIPRLELQHSGRIIYETSRPFGNISVQQEQGTMQSLMDALYQPPPGESNVWQGHTF